MKRNSHKLINVVCEFQASENCIKEKMLSYRDFQDNKDRNDGKYMCFYCSRKIKFSGKSNPNSKYSFEHSFFKNIDSEIKAYALGLISSDGSINKDKNTIRISLQSGDKNLLLDLRDLISPESPVKFLKKQNMCSFSLFSTEMANDVCKHLQIDGGKKDSIVTFPEYILEDENLKYHLLRGHFDGDGSIVKSNYPECNIASNSEKLLLQIKKYFGGNIGKNRIYWSGNNCLDILSKMYDKSKISLSRKRNIYFDICAWVPSLKGHYGSLPQIKWSKCKENAVAPFKLRASDSGYDITLIDIVKDYGKTKLYGTGIKVQPEFGWYLDLVPRSSIVKTGYTLKNSIGIIDRSYTGEVMVALTKEDESKPDIQLPCVISQLIPRPICHFELIKVDSIEDTSRGEKGFGSSGNG